MLFAINGYGQARQATLSANTVANSKTNAFTVKGKPVTDYSSSKVESWRFVHDGKKLILEPFFMGGTTHTPHKIVECKTLELAIIAIIELKLEINAEQKQEIENQAKGNKIDLVKLGWSK